MVCECQHAAQLERVNWKLLPSRMNGLDQATHIEHIPKSTLIRSASIPLNAVSMLGAADCCCSAEYIEFLYARPDFGVLQRSKSALRRNVHLSMNGPEASKNAALASVVGIGASFAPSLHSRT